MSQLYKGEPMILDGDAKPNEPVQVDGIWHVNPTDKSDDVTTDTPDLEKYPHLGAKQHAPYVDRPEVQRVNDTLTDESPTGYKLHDKSVDLDKAQLASMEPSNTDGYREAEQRVNEDAKFRHEPVPFPAKSKVRFVPDIGEDTVSVYTVKGEEVGDNQELFNTLEERVGLFPPQNLVTAE